LEIDFGKLIGKDEAKPTNPRDIFLTLDKSPEFSFLRDVQSDVLDAWYEKPDERDAVIKLNVGSQDSCRSPYSAKLIECRHRTGRLCLSRQLSRRTGSGRG